MSMDKNTMRSDQFGSYGDRLRQKLFNRLTPQAPNLTKAASRIPKADKIPSVSEQNLIVAVRPNQLSSQNEPKHIDNSATQVVPADTMPDLFSTTMREVDEDLNKKVNTSKRSDDINNHDMSPTVSWRVDDFGEQKLDKLSSRSSSPTASSTASSEKSVRTINSTERKRRIAALSEHANIVYVPFSISDFLREGKSLEDYQLHVYYALLNTGDENIIGEPVYEPYGCDSPTQTNFESFTMVWCDRNANETWENRHIQFELRRIISYLKIFDNVQQCYEYIKTTTDSKIVLLVHNEFAQKLIAEVHHFDQIIAIYFYAISTNGTTHVWYKKYSKIEGVAASVNDLIQQIRDDHVQHQRMDDADVPLMVENFASFVPMDSGNVLRFKLVIYILTNMKEIVIDRIKCFKEANKKYPRCTVEQFDKFINEYEVPSTEVVTELVNACRGIYHIETELALIDEFATNYTAEKALWWYTRESPFFRLLNGALRKQDIRMLYLLRFFIRDIYRQLLQNKKPLVMNVPCVYRGQSVSTDELNSIKSSFGYCLMMNSFISASTDRRTAVSYAISSKIREGRHPVLLEIQVATDSGEAVPYADIHDISDVPVENEILFMCGGVFKINDLNYDKNEKLWILKLDLCGESEMKYNDAYQLLKQDIGDYITIIDLGNAVINLGKFDIAEDLYLQGLKKTSRSDEENISRCYERLGSVSFLKGDVDKAVDLIKYSIELMSNSRKFTQENNYLYIYFNYYSLGVAYMEKKDYVLARKNFEAALEYQMRMNELHPSLLLDVYVKIASTYCYEKNYHSAQISLTQAFGIMNDNMLQAHPLSAAALELLGDIHVGNEEYRKALKLYQESIELQCLTQTKSCMSTGSIMKKISDVCKELAKERLSQQDPDKEFKIADEHTDDLINPAMILFNIVKKLVP